MRKFCVKVEINLFTRKYLYSIYKTPEGFWSKITFKKLRKQTL